MGYKDDLVRLAEDWDTEIQSDIQGSVVRVTEAEKNQGGQAGVRCASRAASPDEGSASTSAGPGAEDDPARSNDPRAQTAPNRMMRAADITSEIKSAEALHDPGRPTGRGAADPCTGGQLPRVLPEGGNVHHTCGRLTLSTRAPARNRRHSRRAGARNCSHGRTRTDRWASWREVASAQPAKYSSGREMYLIDAPTRVAIVPPACGTAHHRGFKINLILLASDLVANPYALTNGESGP